MNELSNYVINPKGEIVYSYFFQELNKWLEREREYKDSFLKGADQMFAEIKSVSNLNNQKGNQDAKR